jgi:hypothetical protein
MSKDSYKAIMDQKADIMRSSVGIDYEKYTTGPLSFDYEAMLNDTGYDLDTIRDIQGRTAVGDTPLVELRNLTELVRAVSEPGKGARLLVKDEAANPSGSFKDRRASLSAFEAKKKGYAGIAAATTARLWRPRRPRRDWDASSCRKPLTAKGSPSRRSPKRHGPARRMVPRSFACLWGLNSFTISSSF